MAALANLSREERIGLGVAMAAHVALAAAFFVQPESRDAYAPPERMDVSLASEVSLRSTAPDPSAQPAAAIAPELSAEPEPAPAPVVETVEAAPEAVTPPPRPSVSQPAPRPRPQPTPTARPPQQAPERPTPTPAPQPSRPATASRLGENFLEGTSAAQGDSGSPAREAGPAQRASIVQAINRQLKPNWNPPSGVDVDQLVTRVSFRLNRDGSLAGNPRLIGTTGVNDTNRAQVSRHQEQAIRAVRVTAPFNLPERYYSVWQDLEWNFDNRLAQ